jgi:hypothetical protein
MKAKGCICKMSTTRMLVAMAFLLAFKAVGAFCPYSCDCDDTKMKVVCESKANLDIIPITLNPSIKEIHLRGNKIR